MARYSDEGRHAREFSNRNKLNARRNTEYEKKLGNLYKID